MIIEKNRVLVGGHPRRRMRVVDFLNLNDSAVSVATQIVWIDIDTPKAKPEFIGKASLLEKIAQREYQLCDVPQRNLNLENLSKADRTAMNRRWALWERVKNMTPDIYLPNLRGKLAQKLADEKFASKPLFYRVLELIFQNGPSYSSLATDLSKCGAPGVARITEDSTTKLGRPRTVQPGVGLIMTEEHLQKMRLAWQKSPVGKDGKNLKSCWRWMLITLYPDQVSLTSVDRLVVDCYDLVPTFDQFKYQWEKEKGLKERLVRRHTQRGYDLMFKPLLTGTLQEVHGPGQRYYIDATKLDIYCVSRKDPNLVVGRPTLYVVVDQFSRMIVGMYVGLEAPSWVGAMLALWNCSQDKVEFCAKYGIPIEPEFWPVGGIPTHLMGDRGELMSHDAERLLHGFNIDVENSAPYSGQAKGVAERVFRTLQDKYGPYMPGYVDKSRLGRGHKSPALNAALNLDELTGLLIWATLELNLRVIKGYESGLEQISQGVSAVPLELWHWGVKNLSVGFKTFDEAHLRKHLWPSTRLKITRNGLQLHRGLYYFGAAFDNEPWYLEAQQRGDTVEAFYHPNDIKSVVIVPTGSREATSEVSIAPRSKRFSGLSYKEILDFDAKDKQNNTNAQWEQLPKQLALEADIQAMVKAAKSRLKEQKDNSLSDRQRLKNIGQNRRNEKDEIDRSIQSAFSGKQQPPENTDFEELDSEAQSNDSTLGLIASIIKGGGSKS